MSDQGMIKEAEPVVMNAQVSCQRDDFGCWWIFIKTKEGQEGIFNVGKVHGCVRHEVLKSLTSQPIPEGGY
jgi:hypothetical protein